jgi:hypothetical protein
MKKLVLLLLVMLFDCFFQKAIAYDFSAVNDYNQTIWYNITSDSTVEVTHEGTIGSRGIYQGIKYYGDIVIPLSVINNGITYNVTSITIAAFMQSYVQSVIIPNSVVTIEDFAFNQCTELKTVKFSNYITTIGNGAFQDCESLTSIAIPNSVTSIGYNSFFSCGSLDTLIIGNSVSSIGQKAFSWCPITYIISYSITPPIIYENTFDCYSAYISVPCGSLESYQESPYWSNFTNIHENCIGIKEIEETNKELFIYPNPARDNINLKIDGFSQGLVFVYDIMGKEILSKQIIGNETIMDISNFPSGVYIIKAISIDNKLISSSKLIKNKRYED